MTEILQVQAAWATAGYYGAFVRDPGGSNVETMCYRRGKYLPAGKPRSTFPVGKYCRGGHRD
jgi:hypothetical protein